MKLAQYALIFMCYLLLHSGEVLAEHKVVIVVSKQSAITDIDFLSLRKIYLGITYRQQGKVITGLINTTDETLNQIFLQSIAFMSERSYQRRLLSITLKYGKPRLPIFNNQALLLNALSNDPYSISYMWQEDVEAIEDSGSLKILKTIWEK